MRAAIYIRVSTQEQASEGFSLPAQTQKLRAYCESQDWRVADVYADEGFSAKDTERPSLQRLMQDISNRQIDVVLVYKLDRLTRSVSDLYELLRWFDKYDVGFKSATEVFDTTTAIGRLFITMVAAMAQWERETIGERVSVGMAQKALEGKRVTASAPFGYIKRDDTLVVHEAEAEIVREVFRKYISGHGLHRLQKWLQSTDVGGRIADPHTIAYMLENPVYIGKLRWGFRSSKSHQEVIITDGDHPPIIDDETWQLAQATRGRRRRASPRAGTGLFPFTGILYCSQCGGKMVGYHGRKYRYYRCGNHRLNTCRAKMVRCDVMEPVIIGLLDEMSRESLTRGTPPASIANACTKNRDVDRARSLLEARKRRLWDAYERATITLQELSQRLQRIEQAECKLDVDELNAPEEEPSDRASRPSAAEAAGRFKVGWELLQPLQRKELARALIERIDVDHKHIQVELKQM